MSEKIRVYDSNTRRKTNKQYHQLEKNILEKNYFSYVGIVKELNQGPQGFESKWCKITIIPTITYKEFDRVQGFSPVSIKQDNEAIALIPVDLLFSIEVGDVVLVIFTDVNFKKAMIDILKGYDRTNNFFETDTSKHSLNFGIITNILLKKEL